MTMHIDQQFEELIQKKYEEAKEANAKSILLSEEFIGGITLFINEKPAIPMITFTAGDDVLYVGASEIISTS